VAAQSRPLVVVHDPPGGQSFSSYSNAVLGLTAEYSAESDVDTTTASVDAHAAVGFAVESDTAVLAAPMGVGVSFEIPVRTLIWSNCLPAWFAVSCRDGRSPRLHTQRLFLIFQCSLFIGWLQAVTAEAWVGGGAGHLYEHMDATTDESREVTRDLRVSFTYSTSGEADKAGAASDAFLVPSIWFEVHRVWQVSARGNVPLRPPQARRRVLPR